MGTSTGNAFSSSSEYHSFVTDDPIMIELGLGSFTKESIDRALLELKNNYSDEIGDEPFFSRIQTANGSNGLSIVLNGRQDVISLVTDFETQIESLYTEYADKDSAYSAHQATHRWLKANVSQYARNGMVISGPIFASSGSFTTTLYFHMPGDGVDKHERVSAEKGFPNIAAVATSATGLKYSRSKTDKARAELHAGVYVKPSDATGGVTEDLAAGPLRLSYNDSLGAWESTQTILARLITPLSAAGNTAFIMPEEDSQGYLRNDTDGNAFYEESSKFYTGNFSTGIAVPVSAQDGNPTLFGPNIIIDYNAKRVEKIIVVNRSEKSFTAGTLVMCTLIGSEWIAQEFSLAGEGMPTRLGTWTFSKLIANSDAFFRDAAMSNNLWSFGKYESYAKARWYYEWNANVGSGGESLLPFHNALDIMQLNGGSADHDFYPSLGYFAAYSGDSAKYCNYTNASTAMSELGQDYLMGEDIQNWWGPSFPDGYQSSIGERGGGGGANYNLYFPSTSFSGPASDIPADMAVNGVYSDDNKSSPIMPLDYWQSLLSSNSLYSASNQYRGSYAYGSERGLTPANPNLIQFTPLPAEMVIHSDPQNFVDSSTEKRGSIKTAMNGYAQGDPHMFGKMFSRFSTSNVGNYLPYDQYIKSAPLSIPLGTLLLYGSTDTGSAYEGLNLVGITAAINRFTRPGGGTVNMEVYEDFGPPQFSSVSGGQDAVFSSVAAVFGIVAFTPAGSPVSRSWPQYGSTFGGPNSFGTTALHCRVFDAWPRSDTIWDTRFFSVLHFNPSSSGGDSANVDFRVPTYKNGSYPSSGTAVNSGTDFKDPNEWTVDTIRQGKLVSSGGFVYRKLTVGLSPNVQIIKAGSNVEGETLEIDKYNIKMKIEASGGAVQSVSFPSQDALGNILSGEDMSQKDFSDRYYDNSDPNNVIDVTGYIVRVGDAVLAFQGVVRYIPKLDPGPKEHGASTRLTSGTADAGRITGNKSTEFGLEPNDSGEYEAYFFFHNDISHTFQFRYPGAQYPGYAQYVTLNIS
jgi:hypothetical protein